VDLTNEDVTEILALLDSLPYDSLDVETPRFRLTLRRAPDGGWTEESQVLAEPSVATPAPNGSSAPQSGTSDISGMSGRAGKATLSGTVRDTEGAGEAGAAEQAGGSEAAAGVAAGANGLAVVAAPLPGTFYRAPRPGADPFVQAGDVVTPDTVVAIVETMKLMNSVHAGTAGRVARICLDNGEFAPIGSTLMLIEPDA
jgi:acetyl-CoA carboxylase biotin carboxyl carrier protein